MAFSMYFTLITLSMIYLWASFFWLFEYLRLNKHIKNLTGVRGMRRS